MNEESTAVPVKKEISDHLLSLDVSRALRGAKAKKPEASETELALEVRSILNDEATRAGETIDETQLERSIRAYNPNRYSFREAGRASKRMLSTYLNRPRMPTIPPYAWITAVTAAITAATITLSLNTMHKKDLLEAESDAEAAIERRYRFAGTLQDTIKTLTEEGRGNDERLHEARKLIQGTENFFSFYCPEGNSKRVITPSNYAEVLKKATEIDPLLEHAGTKVNAARVDYNLDLELARARKSMDVSIGQIRSSGIGADAVTRAESLYSQGYESLKKRDIDAARKYNSQISDIQNKARAER